MQIVTREVWNDFINRIEKEVDPLEAVNKLDNKARSKASKERHLRRVNAPHTGYGVSPFKQENMIRNRLRATPGKWAKNFKREGKTAEYRFLPLELRREEYFIRKALVEQQLFGMT